MRDLIDEIERTRDVIGYLSGKVNKEKKLAEGRVFRLMSIGKNAAVEAEDLEIVTRARDLACLVESIVDTLINAANAAEEAILLADKAEVKAVKVEKRYNSIGG